MLSEELENKLNNLKNFLADKKIIVAFSGGVDSSLLAFLSKKFGKNTLLVTEQSILYPDEEIEFTKNFSKTYNIEHILIHRNPLENSEFTANPKNRCYICKISLYNGIKEILEKKDFDIIVDGSNMDDLDDFRPGMKALEELDISLPYIKYNITKSDIRNLSKYFGLKIYSKPSMACFVSRIPYNEIINQEKIERIKKAEKFLKKKYNLFQLRVRHHKNKLARIELLSKEFSTILNEKDLKIINKKLKDLGFNYVTLDLEGFRSGSLNLSLTR